MTDSIDIIQQYFPDIQDAEELVGGSTNSVVLCRTSGEARFVFSRSIIDTNPQALHNGQHFPRALAAIEQIAKQLEASLPEGFLRSPLASPLRCKDGKLVNYGDHGALYFASEFVGGMEYAQTKEAGIDKHDAIAAAAASLGVLHGQSVVTASTPASALIPHPFPPQNWPQALQRLAASAIGKDAAPYDTFWNEAINTITALQDEFYVALASGSTADYPYCLTHGDVKLPNVKFLQDEDSKALTGVWFDFDFVSHGYRIKDLADFISRNCFDKDANDAGYFTLDTVAVEKAITAYEKHGGALNQQERDILPLAINVSAAQWVCHSAMKASQEGRPLATVAKDMESITKYLARTDDTVNEVLQGLSHVDQQDILKLLTDKVLFAAHR